MENYLKGIKLLQTRTVIAIVGKVLNVTDAEIEITRRKLKGIEKDQRMLAQVVQGSISILNVRRLELVEV